VRKDDGFADAAQIVDGLRNQSTHSGVQGERTSRGRDLPGAIDVWWESYVR
jgi:hypothetical protein